MDAGRYCLFPDKDPVPQALLLPNKHFIIH